MKYSIQFDPIRLEGHWLVFSKLHCISGSEIVLVLANNANPDEIMH